MSVQFRNDGQSTARYEPDEIVAGQGAQSEQILKSVHLVRRLVYVDGVDLTIDRDFLVHAHVLVLRQKRQIRSRSYEDGGERHLQMLPFAVLRGQRDRARRFVETRQIVLWIGRVQGVRGASVLHHLSNLTGKRGLIADVLLVFRIDLPCGIRGTSFRAVACSNPTICS